MAALPLFKLLCKTCSCSVNPARYIPTIRFLSVERDSTHESRKSTDRPRRSYSTPSRSSIHTISKKGKEQCIQVRKISRSVENLKNYRHSEDKEIPAFRYSKPVVEAEDDAVTEEFLAEEPEPEPPKPEINFENNVRYELTSTKHTEENYSDVLGYMMDYEMKKPVKIFPHLQPFNMRPYGSTETMMFPSLPKRPTQIVYPPNAFIAGSKDTNQDSTQVLEELEMPEPTAIDKGFERNLSRYVQEKEYPGYEEAKKMVVCETPSKTQQNLSRKNYSTTAVHMPSAKRIGPPQMANFSLQRLNNDEILPPKSALRHPLLKEVRSAMTKKKESVTAKPAPQSARRYKIGDLFVNSALKLDLPTAATKSNIEKVKMDALYSSWTGIDSKKSNRLKESLKQIKCEDLEVDQPQVMVKKTRSHSKNSTKLTYSTGLLSRSKHTLPLQNNSSRNLVKTYTSSACKKKEPDCCCKEYETVKLSELQEECIKAGKCKPKPKTGRLPKFVPADCPCREDPPLKQGKPLVPLKKRYEPKAPSWTCADLKACTQPRADDNYTLREKRLPKLAARCCPITESKWKDLKIRRLPKRKAVDPPRIIPEPEKFEEQVRADDCLKTEKKQLPVLKPQLCPRLDDRPLPGKPLTRLKPRPVNEKPKIYHQNIIYDAPRADEGLTLKPKKLPVHKPHDCPSPQQLDMPPMPLKRIKWATIPDPVRVSPVEEESRCILIPRADDNLTVAPKKLPLMKPLMCPSHEELPPHLNKPLPRLKAKLVCEKPRIHQKNVHSVPRADEGIIAKPKKLPTYKAKDCPSPDNRPLPVKPLARRARIKFKPIVEKSKVSPEVIVLGSPRADDGLVMLPKKLPVHKAQKCPCPENHPPPSKPLPRLKSKPVKYPQKFDLKPTSQQRTIRADEGLTMLPKVLPVLKATSCPPPPEQLHTVSPKLARIKFKPIQEPEKIRPVPESCKVVERADEHDWMYWRKLDVGKCEKKDPCPKPEPCTETSLIVRPEDCLNENTWLPPVPFNEMTDKKNLSCGSSPKRGYCTSCCSRNTSVIAVRLFNTEDVFDMKVPFNKSKPVDKVGILVCNSKIINSAHVNEPLARTQSQSGGVNARSFNNFNTVSRFVSTYKSLQQKISRPPPTPDNLQPKKKILKQREHFMNPYPDDNMIENARSKSLGRSRGPIEDCADPCVAKCSTAEENLECQERSCCDDEDERECQQQKGKGKVDDACRTETLTLWQRIVNFFKARDCPSPEEFRKMRLREDAEKAAAKAGLCVYDPLKCKADGEKLPKVLTADCENEEDQKDKHNC